MKPTIGKVKSAYFLFERRRRVALSSEMRQGSGGAAPSGVQGRSPGGGLGGRSPPEIFVKIKVIW